MTSVPSLCLFSLLDPLLPKTPCVKILRSEATSLLPWKRLLTLQIPHVGCFRGIWIRLHDYYINILKDYTVYLHRLGYMTIYCITLFIINSYLSLPPVLVYPLNLILNFYFLFELLRTSPEISVCTLLSFKNTIEYIFKNILLSDYSGIRRLSFTFKTYFKQNARGFLFYCDFFYF